MGEHETAKRMVEGPGDYLFIQCYRILGRRTCTFFGVKKHFAIFAIYHPYHADFMLRTKSDPAAVSGRKQIDSPKGPNYLTSTV